MLLFASSAPVHAGQQKYKGSAGLVGVKVAEKGGEANGRREKEEANQEPEGNGDEGGVVDKKPRVVKKELTIANNRTTNQEKDDKGVLEDVQNAIMKNTTVKDQKILETKDKSSPNDTLPITYSLIGVR